MFDVCKYDLFVLVVEFLLFEFHMQHDFFYMDSAVVVVVFTSDGFYCWLASKKP